MAEVSVRMAALRVVGIQPGRDRIRTIDGVKIGATLLEKGPTAEEAAVEQ
jgi:hypothetical protein